MENYNQYTLGYLLKSMSNEFNLLHDSIKVKSLTDIHKHRIQLGRFVETMEKCYPNLSVKEEKKILSQASLFMQHILKTREFNKPKT